MALSSMWGVLELLVAVVAVVFPYGHSFFLFVSTDSEKES